LTTAVIADDHAFFKTGLKAALTSWGIDVVATADNGKTALLEIGNNSPDFVLFDIRMPTMDGVTAFEALRDSGDNRPVIMLVSELSDSELVRLMKRGIDAVVFKDAPEERLREAIDAVTSGQRYIDFDLVDRAIAASDQSVPDSLLVTLTPRERKIADEVALGQKNKVISEKLQMSEANVKINLHNIYKKLGISNRTELAILLRTGQS
jgi:two-component system nitrate/nitrite response regulator NarP